MVTLTIPRVSVLIIFTLEAIRLSGLRVWSDEYSNPSLIILTLLTFPIEDEVGTTTASLPVEEFLTSIKSGSFL